MTSTLQSALTAIQLNDYVTLAILTSVGYDYVLTFSQEIEHIWTKPWTWMSTLFVLIRYVGLYSIAIPNLSRIIDVISAWTFLIFLGAADLVMILRIWVIYNRSKLILGTLLVLFALEMIATALAVVITSIPGKLTVPDIQILNFSFCLVEFAEPIWQRAAAILQIVHGTTVFTLAVFQFARLSLQMYRANKQWQINQYLRLLIKQGILYFFATFIFSLVNVLNASGEFPTGGWQPILLYILEYVPIYTLTPRLILSVREMYCRKVCCGTGIDTGFGFSDATVETMMFMERDQDEEGTGEVRTSLEV